MAFRGYLKLNTQTYSTIYMESNAAPKVGVTGLAAGITKYYSKTPLAGGTSIIGTMTTTEIDATNMTGLYSILIPAAFLDTLGEICFKYVGAGASHVLDTYFVVTNLPGEAGILQSGTGTGQVSLSSGLVTLAPVTHTGAVIPVTTTVTDLTVTANAEPAAPPASTATIAAKIAYLFALAKNKITQTATTSTLLANNGSTPIGASTISDDGTTFTRGSFA